jgi:hypothetical protein
LVTSLLGHIHKLEGLPISITEDKAILWVGATVWRRVTVVLYHS